MRIKIILIFILSLFSACASSNETNNQTNMTGIPSDKLYYERTKRARDVYQMQGNLPKALSHAKMAFEFAEKSFGNQDDRTIKAHKSICDIYTWMKNKERALNCLKEVDILSPKIMGLNNLEMAKNYNKRAKLYLDKKQFSKALNYANKALKIRKKEKGIDSLSVAESYQILGQIYLAKKQYTKSFTYTQKSLIIKKKAWGENDLRLAKIYGSMSVLYIQQKNEKQAFIYQRKAFKLMLKIQTLLFQTQSNKSLQFYLKNASFQMNNLLLVAFLSQKKNKNIDYETFNLWLQYKGNMTDKKTRQLKSNKLTIVNQMYTTLFLKYISDSESLSKKETDKLDALALLRAKLEIEQHENIKKTNITSLQISQKLAKDELYLDFTKVNNNFYFLFTLDSTDNVVLYPIVNKGKDRKEFQKKLQKIEESDIDITDEIALDDMFENMQKNIKIILEKQKEESAKIQRELKEVNQKLLKKLHEEMNKKPNERKVVDYSGILKEFQEKQSGYIFPIDKIVQNFRKKIKTKKETRELGNQLYNLLLNDPIPNLSKYKKFIISSDGHLNLLPFEALTTDKGKYLIQKLDITYIGSGKAFLRAYENKNKLPKDNKLVLLSNLNYNDNALENLPTSNKEQNKSIDNIFHNWSRLKPLKSGQTEANVMQRLYTKEHLLSYTKNQGTKQLLYSLKSPKILHLSTHSFYGKDSNQTIDSLLKSAIALSGYNAILSIEDNRGLMTALEFSTLNLLHTELVFFSSCESGLGDIYSSEGVEGLTKSAKIAGAKRVISTLWAVSDKETSELTKRFYGYLYKNKLGYLDALKQSKLDMIHLHPYYWAGFIEYGLD